MEERTEAKREFFAAANSGNGFVSFYPQIFGNKSITRRYLIKGGPGTGKSTFMKNLAKRAQGCGLDVEYYRCSSDPTSLDAIIIAGRVAVIDATSPHCVEGECVGARDELINLGAFWNSDALGEMLEEVQEISKIKSDCYARAYRFLAAAMQVDEARRELGAKCADREKMRKAAKRMAARIPDGKGFEIKTRLCDSIGMSGRVRLDGYENTASKVYVIQDEYKLASMLLTMLADEARSKGCAVSASYCPITPSYLDALLFEESGTAFVIEDNEKESLKGCTYINMKRFVSNVSKKDSVKTEYKSYSRLFEGLVRSAQDALEKAGREHFKLEKMYRENMDFFSLNIFLDEVATKIIKTAYKDGE